MGRRLGSRIQSLCHQDPTPTPSSVLPIVALSQDCHVRLHLQIQSSKYGEPAQDPHTAGPHCIIATTFYRVVDSEANRMS